MFNLRPDSWDQYIGQRNVVERLSVMVQAAKARDGGLDHILFTGPPGLGKTSLSRLVAGQMGVPFHPVNGAALQGAADLSQLLMGLEPNAVLFIDEIHRVNTRILEMIYPALEDGQLELTEDDGKGGTRVVSIPLDPFTLVAATTRSGMLSAALRRRFPAQFILDFYEDTDLCVIAAHAAHLLDFNISCGGLTELATRSLGTPGLLMNLLKRVRDYHTVRYADSAAVMSDGEVRLALDHLGIWPRGLNDLQVLMLRVLEQRKPRKIGVDNIATIVGEDRGVIEDVVEPALIRFGLVERASNGRAITDPGQAYLKELDQYHQERKRV